MLGNWFKPRKLEISGGYVLVEAIEAQTEFIGDGGREGVIFAGVKQLVSDRVGSEESPQLSRVVQQVFLVVDESSANLVFVRNVVIDALHVIGPALPCCRNDGTSPTSTFPAEQLPFAGALNVLMPPAPPPL